MNGARGVGPRNIQQEKPKSQKPKARGPEANVPRRPYDSEQSLGGVGLHNTQQDKQKAKSKKQKAREQGRCGRRKIARIGGVISGNFGCFPEHLQLESRRTNVAKFQQI